VQIGEIGTMKSDCDCTHQSQYNTLLLCFMDDSQCLVGKILLRVNILVYRSSPRFIKAIKQSILRTLKYLLPLLAKPGQRDDQNILLM